MDLDYLNAKREEEAALAQEARVYEDDWGEEAETHEMRVLIIDDMLGNADEEEDYW